MKQNVITAGDSLFFDTSVPVYPARDGWTLTYRLVPRASGVVITFDASANGNDYRVQVGPSTTSGWPPAVYSWAAYVHKSGERYKVDEGEVTVEPDYATVTQLDNRSHARRTLAAIEAVIEQRATVDQMAYTIGSRQLSRMPIADLLKFRGYYRGQVYAEEQREAAESGQGTSKVVVRL